MMYPTRKTLIQCDFDGTITEKDVSFTLLDNFADGDWRPILKRYKEGEISVGCFNSKAFAMVKSDRQSLLDSIRGQIKVRDGFHELVAYCRRNGFHLVIVSNGLDFYIEAILRDIGAEDIPVFAARSRFSPGGMDVQYVGPDGRHLPDGLKEAYAGLFLRSGNQVTYVGNGPSDFPAAKLCHHIFARDELLGHCKKANIDYYPFTDFNDIVRVLVAR